MDGDAPHASRLPSLNTPEGASAQEAPLPAETPAATPARKTPRHPPDEQSRLRAVLVERGLADDAQIDAAEAALRGTPLSLGQVLTVRGVISEAELLSALTQIYGVGLADLSTDPPSPALARYLPAGSAITAEAVVWKSAGSALVVATARPDRVQDLHGLMPEGRRIVTVLAARQQILDAQRLLYGAPLARRAEGRAPERVSCRAWRSDALSRYILAAALCLISLYLLVPEALVVGLISFSIIIYIANCTLKFSAFAQALRGATGPPPVAGSEPRFLHQPTVTLLVPLLREPEVAGALVDRLRRIDYPRERLDVILAVEANDPLTLAALRGRSLPAWMRAVVVPSGSPQTKPRALNYALNYARGDIVGIYDAEDRPEPDQITRVVRRFGEVPPQVACLQGQLDYYNARHNWLSRLFTVEYAAWFRVLLPGVQRMGLVVPLGGTTVFLRRNVLEEVGAWDAHNVTEDAELGLRLTRAGYATEIVETTTFEEANAAALPWIKQRSRWLKGYLMTWGAAMRRPAVLLEELGAWRFWWMQIQFGGAVLGFLTAPLLWSFMLKPFGVWHPMDVVLSPFAYGFLATIMLTGLVGSVAISIHACRAAHLRHLRPISPLVEPYYLFGTVAAWIGLFELMARPFFWAKTTHGRFGAAKLGNLEATGPAGGDQTRCASSRSRT